MTVLPVMSLCSPLELPWLADSTEYSLWTLATNRTVLTLAVPNGGSGAAA
jgi:hypothetical protein